MKAQMGVWIDHAKAYVYTIADETIDMKHVASGVESRHRSTGGVRSFRPYWHRSVISGKRAAAHRAENLKRFFKKVSVLLAPAEDIVVLGPGQAKTEFVHFLQETGRLRETAHVATTNSKMSQAQILKCLLEILRPTRDTESYSSTCGQIAAAAVKEWRLQARQGI